MAYRWTTHDDEIVTYAIMVGIGGTSAEMLSFGLSYVEPHIHTPMPVILEEHADERWLAWADQGSHAKALLLGAQIDSQLEFHRVDRAVNNSRHEGTDTKKPPLNSL